MGKVPVKKMVTMSEVKENRKKLWAQKAPLLQNISM